MSLVLGTATGRDEILRQQDSLHDLPLSPYFRPGETRRAVILSKNTGGAMYQRSCLNIPSLEDGEKTRSIVPQGYLAFLMTTCVETTCVETTCVETLTCTYIFSDEKGARNYAANSPCSPMTGLKKVWEEVICAVSNSATPEP